MSYLLTRYVAVALSSGWLLSCLGAYLLINGLVYPLRGRADWWRILGGGLLVLTALALTGATVFFLLSHASANTE